MPLTVTPGGAADDALVELDAFKSYCDARGYAYGDDDTVIEQAIRRGTVWVEGVGAESGLVKSRWPGKKASATQRRAWPRSGATDVDGLSIDDATIPFAVQDAVCEAAFYDIANPGILHKAITPSDVVKSESVGGDGVKVTYQDGVDHNSARAMLSVVSDLLSGILVTQSTGPKVFMTSLG